MANFIVHMVKDHFLTTYFSSFGPQKVLMQGNAWKWMCRFSSLGTSKVPKLILKAVFFYQVLYKYYSIFLCWAFRLKKWRFKKWISHCIFKMWFKHDLFLGEEKKNLKRPNTPKYTKVLVVACVKLKSNGAL